MVNNTKHKQFTFNIKVNKSARANWRGYAWVEIKNPDYDLLRTLTIRDAQLTSGDAFWFIN